jgi:hypothetical protein
MAIQMDSPFLSILKKKKKMSSLDSQKIYKLAYKTMQSYKFKYN